MVFSLGMRDEAKNKLMKQHPNTKIQPKDVVSECARMWNTLTSAQKQPYRDSYAKSLELYRAQNTRKKTGGVTPKFNAYGELPNTPEGFSGAVNGFLLLSVKDPQTGKHILKKFADFNDAVVEAMRLGDACGGITRTSKGYSLRAGNVVKTNWKQKDCEELRSIEYSWVKTSTEPTLSTELETEDEEFHDALPDNETIIKNEVIQISTSMESLIEKMEALQTQIKMLIKY